MQLKNWKENKRLVSIINFLKEHKVLLITLWVLISLLLVHIIIHLYFITGYHLDWSLTGTTIFNNIATPIAAIVSGVLLYRALTATNKQNRISTSNSLLSHFEDKFKRIEDSWDAKGNLPRGITYKTLFHFIHKAFNSLKDDSGYELILRTREETKFTYNDFARLNRWEDVDLLNYIVIDALVNLMVVTDFIKEINNEPNLINEHKRMLKAKIRENLVNDYMTFIKSNDFDRTIFLIPLIHDKDKHGFIPFEQMHRTRFRRFYDFFRNELE